MWFAYNRIKFGSYCSMALTQGVKGELHLKFSSIRIKISKFQKHHNKIPKHVFYHLVKFFLNFHTFYSKKTEFR